MNVDIIMFENYLDQVVLEDEAMMIYIEEKSKPEQLKDSTRKNTLKKVAVIGVAIGLGVTIVALINKIMSKNKQTLSEEQLKKLNYIKEQNKETVATLKVGKKEIKDAKATPKRKKEALKKQNQSISIFKNSIKTIEKILKNNKLYDQYSSDIDRAYKCLKDIEGNMMNIFFVDPMDSAIGK